MAERKIIHHWIMAPLAGAVLLVLSSCTTASSVKGGRDLVIESAYGSYLAARYATATNDVQAAADFYEAALEKEPDNPLLRQQTFLGALFAGNIAKAAGFARPVLGTDAETRLMRLGVAAFDLRQKQFTNAADTLSGGEYGPFNGEVGKLLQGWAAYGAGDVDKALAMFGSAIEAPAFSQVSRLNMALIFDLAGREAEAELAYTAVVNKNVMSDRAVFAYGSFLERQHRTEEARALYERLFAVFAEAPLSRSSLVRLDAEKSAIAPRRLVRNAREGAAEAFFGPAQVLAARGHFDRALVYLEMARFINPHHDAAIELLARLMDIENRSDDALLTFDSIAERSPYRMQADLGRAQVLFRVKRRDEALGIFQGLADAHPQKDRLASTYADALRAMSDYESALPIYERLIEGQGEDASWELYFSRGTVLERLGRWRESVVDFRKALVLNPDQPDVLNYLGYTFIDVGENLDEGFELIERAVSLRPDAGYIVDSLGWAHYRLGHYQRAVRYLERAVELEPGEPTISDHLGDAYWQAGRQLEARFQWSHTLSLEPNDDIDLELVNQKLQHGLQDTSEIANATP